VQQIYTHGSFSFCLLHPRLVFTALSIRKHGLAGVPSSGLPFRKFPPILFIALSYTEQKEGLC